MDNIQDEVESKNRSDKLLIKLDAFRDACEEVRTSNVFESVLLQFLFILESMIDIIKEEGYGVTLDTFPYCFNDDVRDKLFSLRQKVTHIIRNEDKQYRAIYDFAKFLITADALLMYNNDDTEAMYSIAESADSIKLVIITDDYNIGYYFTKDLTTDKNKSILEQYIDSDMTDTVIGMVEVKRNNGSKTKSNFGFDMNGNVRLTSYKDEILFHTLIHTTINMIQDTYSKILDKSYPVYIGEKNEKFKMLEYICGFGVQDTATE